MLKRDQRRIYDDDKGNFVKLVKRAETIYRFKNLDELTESGCAVAAYSANYGIFYRNFARDRYTMLHLLREYQSWGWNENYYFNNGWIQLLRRHEMSVDRAALIRRFRYCLRGNDIDNNCPAMCKKRLICAMEGSTGLCRPIVKENTDKIEQGWDILRKLYTRQEYECQCRGNFYWSAKNNICLRRDTDVCRGDICTGNNGECIPDESKDGRSCMCRPAFEGQNCQYARDPCIYVQENACRPHKCQRDPDNWRYGLKCDCSAGYTLAHDEKLCVDIDECIRLYPCANRGTCSNFDGGYMCLCRDGFNGTHCDKNIEKLPSWSAWGDWGMCSKTCGDGIVQRRRTCTDPSRCVGLNVENARCERMPKCENRGYEYPFQEQVISETEFEYMNIRPRYSRPYYVFNAASNGHYEDELQKAVLFLILSNLIKM